MTGVAAAAGPVAAPDGRPRRRWPLWAALVVVVLVLACGLPAALLVSVLRDTDGGTPVTAAAPTENPTTLAAQQVAERISVQLNRQSAALLGGDRAGFLAIAEAGSARTELRRRYDSLRALRVKRWEASASGLPTETGQAGEWRLRVQFNYCFVVAKCQTSPMVVDTRWRDGAEPRLLEIERSKSSPYVIGAPSGQPGDLPWEVSELTAAVGKRTIVATTPAYRNRLPYLLARAEAAAKVADLYAVAGTPDRYRIFYAGKKEWETWYGGEQPEWGIGYAISVGGGHHEVVLGPDSLEYGPFMDQVLRHELAHAASMPDGYWEDWAWWLVEGVAEHAAVDGQPVARYMGLTETRQTVRGNWDGELDDLMPTGDISGEEVTGRYGIAYLAVRYFVDRFGEEQLLAFVKAVVHDLRPPAQIAEEVLGEPWSDLHDECVAYIRRAAG
ncbi:hypothetical protein [Micromonospora sp. NPDC051296]|uniref:hypothetical protein n=1 Tax=Micromonospora sp. NPDC051296 TaxID=3155046 RepID=UPI003448BBAD